MHWNGATWSVVPSDNVGDQDTLDGVSALAGGAAAAVGSFNDTSGPIPIARTLAETFNGTSLMRTPSPNVNASDNLLRGVATLPGSSTVFAVGFHLQASGPYRTLILRGS